MELTGLQHRLEKASPQWMIRNDRQRLDDLLFRLEASLGNNFRFKRSQALGLTKRLRSLNPFAVLQRGYSIVTNGTGQVVSKVSQVSRDELVDVKLSDGTILTRVISVPGSESEEK